MSIEFDERQYFPSKWSKRLPEDVICIKHGEVATAETKKNKESILSEENVVYGRSNTEVLDIYSKNLPTDAPWFVYIHGGYWIEFTKDTSGYCVYPLWKNGIKVAVPDYDLGPKATITEMVEQMQKMAIYILKRAELEGSRGVWICGHSAGAQLAGRLLDETWLKSLTKKERSLFKGLFLIGGVFDLKPILQLSEVNDVLKMSEEEANSQSPTNHVTDFKGKSLVDSTFKTVFVVAENESPAFKEQSQNYRKLLNDEGMNAVYLDLPELDHFDVVENLRDENYILTQKILEEIKQI